MPYLHGLLLDHPRSSENVRHPPSVVIDRNGYVRLPCERDVRALELHERFGARERTDHGPSHGAVDRLGCVTASLIWIEVGGGSVCHGNRRTIDNHRALRASWDGCIVSS